jgi:Ca2+-binding RTX toxin-like protein
MRRRVVLVLAATASTLLLASGVALAFNKVGTNGPDTLRGTNRADNLLGKGANDVLYALGGRDNLLGGSGKDYVLGGNERIPLGGDKNLAGGPGNDGVYGGIGSDTVVGGPGNDDLGDGRGSDRIVGEEGREFVDSGPGSDRVEGGEGPDWLIDGPLSETSKDTLSGDDGDDVLIANNRPATKDIVSCGGGFDRVAADRKDLVAPDCERVRRGVSQQEIGALFEELGFVEVFEEAWHQTRLLAINLSLPKGTRVRRAGV